MLKVILQKVGVSFELNPLAAAAAKGIPMISVAKNLDLIAELGKLFEK
jgi:hypothetical protein